MKKVICVLSLIGLKNVQHQLHEKKSISFVVEEINIRIIMYIKPQNNSEAKKITSISVA